jgi:ornithine cyclodeaminase
MTHPPSLTTADLPNGPDWPSLIAALEAGHRSPRAEVADVFLGPPERTLLSRSARIEGIGFGVKSVTIVPGNTAKKIPTIQGAMLIFDDADGRHLATLDSGLLTNYKTVSDSLLGAKLLARPESRTLLIVGAGTVARSLVSAYPTIFPGLKEIQIWNRSHENAQKLAADSTSAQIPVRAVSDLKSAVSKADIVTSATMAVDPVILGEWLTPGTHLDLIGAFRADMREVDDTAVCRAKLFVDSRDTTLDHIGELKIPLANGAIQREDILADLYDLIAGRNDPRGAEDITLFKNGGGAHLDVMIAFALVAQTGLL